MSDTINNGIPFVPENTIDPAAGLNESLLIIDRLLQLKVIGMKVNTPAVGPVAGDRYIVGTSPTGAWVGKALQVAEWMPDGYWGFSPASVAVYATSVYINTGTDWIPASAGAGASWGGITGSLGDQADLAAALAGKESELIAGANITIDRSDPEAPVISSSGGGGGGGVESIVAGDGINVDDSDPANPVVSATGSAGTEVNVQTSTAYTLVLTDSFKMVAMDNAGANTLTVPPNSAVAFLANTRIDIGQDGAGKTTIVAGAGVTIRTPETLKLRKQWSKASLIRRAANVWDLVGDLEAAT